MYLIHLSIACGRYPVQEHCVNYRENCAAGAQIDQSDDRSGLRASYHILGSTSIPPPSSSVQFSSGTMPSSIISIGQATGPRRSSCGYCSPPGERSQADTFVQSGGLVGIQLSCDVCTSWLLELLERVSDACSGPGLPAHDRSRLATIWDMVL